MTRHEQTMLIKIGQRPDHGFGEPLGLLSDCHRRIEHFLRVLTTIEERTHAGSVTSAERAQLEAALAYFATAAPKHTADEEQSLFPRLRASSDPAAHEALDTVSRLEQDHRAADRHHASVDRLVRQWLAGGSLNAADAAALREHLTALTDIYTQHIGIEDRVLFPAAARLLSPREIADIGREMAGRRAPSSPK
jgi:hemerythrin-like domain-containing protein